MPLFFPLLSYYITDSLLFFKMQLYVNNLLFYILYWFPVVSKITSSIVLWSTKTFHNLVLACLLALSLIISWSPPSLVKLTYLWLLVSASCVPWHLKRSYFPANLLAFKPGPFSRFLKIQLQPYHLLRSFFSSSLFNI